MTSSLSRLISVPAGRHIVEIQLPNNLRWKRTFDLSAKKKYCITLNYRSKTITVERAVKSPCPYPVNLSAPSSVREGDTVTFSSDVDYSGDSALNYNWLISPPSARITQGVGTPTITVDTTGIGNQRVTAILVVDDGSGDRNCQQRAQAATFVAALPLPPLVNPRKFSEFAVSSFREGVADFDNFAVELQADPTTKGYIIVYNGRRSRPAQLNSLVNRWRGYLVNTRNIDASRIVIVPGGAREVETIELWVVPMGATPPRSSPSVKPSDVQIIDETPEGTVIKGQVVNPSSTATPEITSPDTIPTSNPSPVPANNALQYAILIKGPVRLEAGEWEDIEVSIVDKNDVPTAHAEQPGWFSRLVSRIKQQFFGGSEVSQPPASPFEPPRRSDLPQAKLFLRAKLAAAGYKIEEKNVEYAALDELPLSWLWRIKTDDSAEPDKSLIVKFMSKWRLPSNQETAEEPCSKCAQKFGIEVYTPWVKKGVLKVTSWITGIIGAGITAWFTPWVKIKWKVLARKRRLNRFRRMSEKNKGKESP
jgi:hypothetical protein